MVRETGLEPVRPKTGDFKSPVATITPLSHIWYQELDSNQPHLVLQTSALPDELSWHCLVDDAGFEPATASVSRKYSTTEIIVLGVKWGIEPSLTVSQTAVQPLH